MVDNLIVCVQYFVSIDLALILAMDRLLDNLEYSFMLRCESNAS